MQPLEKLKNALAAVGLLSMIGCSTIQEKEQPKIPSEKEKSSESIESMVAKANPIHLSSEETTYYDEKGIPLQFAEKIANMRDRYSARSYELGDIEKIYFSGNPDLAATLAALKSVGGDPVFNAKSIAKYVQIGGTTSFAKELASLVVMHEPLSLRIKREIKPKTLFDGDDIVNYWKAKGDPEFARSLLEIEKKRGTHLFADGFEVVDYWKAKGTVDYAKRLNELEDCNGLDPFLANDIIKLRKIDAPIEDIENILEKRNDAGKRIFAGGSARRILEEKLKIDDVLNVYNLEIDGKQVFKGSNNAVEFLSIGGKEEIAKKLVSLKDEKGGQYFYGFDIVEVLRSGVGFPVIEKMYKIRNSDGQLLFPHASTLSIFLLDKYTLEDAEKFAQLKNGQGKAVFDSESLFKYTAAQGEVTFAHQAIELKSPSGNPLIRDGYQLAEIVRYNLELNELKRYLKKYDKDPYSGPKAIMAARLRLEGEDFVFKDTKKPNLLLTFPTYDHNGALHTRFEREVMKGWLREHYDIRIEIAHTEKDIYDAIDNTPNLQVLWLAGHGLKESLGLSRASLTDLPEKEYEQTRVDTGDAEFAKYLQKLAPNATIILHSCSTGSGSNNEVNLASKVAEMAPGRTVIASKTSFNASEMNIIGYNPLDAIIRDRENTYKVRYENGKLTVLD